MSRESIEPNLTVGSLITDRENKNPPVKTELDRLAAEFMG